MKNADVAMYQVKENGRNAYRFHDDEHERRGAGAHRPGERPAAGTGAQRVPAALSAAGRRAQRRHRRARRPAVLAPSAARHAACRGVHRRQRGRHRGDADVGMAGAQRLPAAARLECDGAADSLYLCSDASAGRGGARRPAAAGARGAARRPGVDPGLLMLGFGSLPGDSRLAAHPGCHARRFRTWARAWCSTTWATAGRRSRVSDSTRSAWCGLEASFLRGLARDGDLAMVTRAMIHMVHALNLGVVVTGVENAAHASLLRETGCDLAQGPAFGHAGGGRGRARAAVERAPASRCELEARDLGTQDRGARD